MLTGEISYGVIYLCPAFWEAETTGTDSRGGTLIHETSHFDKVRQLISSLRTESSQIP